MDISKLKPVNIAPYAREKVIWDFFPSIAAETEDKVPETDDRVASLHAGALCLYAMTLMTKVHETSTDKIEAHYKERQKHLKELVKSNPKHSSKTDEQIDEYVQNLIYRDIRNSFAHGNFQISYDKFTKKLYYVLYPQRKDFVSSEPIVISKNALLDVNRKFISSKGQTYSFYSEKTKKSLLENNFNKMFVGFVLPTQMLKIADYYMGNKSIRKEEVIFRGPIYQLIQYALISSKITYEQNDYYAIFGRESNIFNAISLIRNSIAHDSFKFVDCAKTINYDDRGRTLTEEVGVSSTKLLIVDMQKKAIKALLDKGINPDSVGDLAEKFNEIYDFFFGGKYDIHEIVSVIEDDEESEIK